jgi:hypothetical protein
VVYPTISFRHNYSITQQLHALVASMSPSCLLAFTFVVTHSQFTSHETPPSEESQNQSTMSSSESEFDPLEALDEIDQDIDNLEAVLKPLFSSSWQEVVGALGHMEQAKMNMIMAYGICDLIWSEFSGPFRRFLEYWSDVMLGSIPQIERA